MIARLTKFAALGALVLTLAVSAKDVAAGRYATLRPVLHRSAVTVLVPAAVPDYFSPLFVTAQAGRPFVRDGGYQVVFGGSPTCDGGTACTFATITGEPGLASSHDGPWKSVRLRSGIHAQYQLRPCTANCEDSFVLQFHLHGATYAISMKGGTLDDGLVLADSLRSL